MPSAAPNVLSVADSTRNWVRMSRRRAPSDFANADLAGPLGDRDEHDVHDHDRADDQPDGRQRDAGDHE